MNMYYQKIEETLFKRSVSGKINQWYIAVEESDRPSIFKISYNYGDINSTTTAVYSNYIEPKNIGKSNETTSFKQAFKQATSDYKNKKKKGYLSINDLLNTKELKDKYSGKCVGEILEALLPKYITDENGFFKPMKAQPYKSGSIKFPAIAQPKINGCRCTVSKSYIDKGLFGKDVWAALKSKEGNDYYQHEIQVIFSNFYKDFPEYSDVVFDGELYCYGEPAPSISGASRNIKNPLNFKLQFICFDLSIPDISNRERDELRLTIAKEMNWFNDCKIQFDEKQHESLKHVKVVFLPSLIITSDEEAYSFADSCLNQKYEGAIIRDLDAQYGFGQRVSTMRKIKKTYTDEFIIKDIKVVGDPKQKVGFSIIYTLQNNITDETFDSNGTGTVEERLDIYINREKYIGKKCIVKYRERTITNLPFHSNVIQLL